MAIFAMTENDDILGKHHHSFCGIRRRGFVLKYYFESGPYESPILRPASLFLSFYLPLSLESQEGHEIHKNEPAQSLSAAYRLANQNQEAFLNYIGGRQTLKPFTKHDQICHWMAIPSHMCNYEYSTFAS